tara:strand:- start:907 stop:1746 length:840 start_codon:yes stop_codon:yes gene_type:complete
MKVGCLIYSDHKKFKNLHDNAVNSFTAFHPDVEMYSFDYTSDCEFIKFAKKTMRKNIPAGPFKYGLGYLLLENKNLDKLIILGADTITCSRLHEFLNDNTHDILTTLDYPYDLQVNNLAVSTSENHVNADVVCFNNKDSLSYLLRLWNENKFTYQEQAALNIICNRTSVLTGFKNKTVDGDFKNSDVVYNVRSKGNFVAQPNSLPWAKYIKKYKVINNKLFTSTHEYISKSKQIKVWHYCQGWGVCSDEEMQRGIDFFTNECFNNETLKFFKETCNCKF